MANEHQTRLFTDEDHPLVSKSWLLKQLHSDEVEQRFKLPKMQSVLLLNRDVNSADEASQYIASDETLSCDPKLMPNIEEGIQLVFDAIISGETIAIYGDFDVDGISGAAILTETMNHIGASVITYIPHRINEGHSLNEDAITYLNSKQAKLIVTVDCGTTAYKEVSFAKDLGINVVVTDHHIANESMPEGVPVVNPGLSESRYPFKHLTGAGVALKFCQALFDKYGETMPDYLYILATLGTIADLGPLIGENRFIVKRGLDLLKYTNHAGIKALAQKANCNLKTVSARDLSFTLIPRLNAAGRLDDPMLSYRLLRAQSTSEASDLARKLDVLNLERRDLTKNAMDIAERKMTASNLEKHILILSDEAFTPGIAGLVASRVVDSHHKPTN